MKKHNRTSPNKQFKEFSLTKQKLHIERTMNELGADYEKPFPKKSDQKIFKKLKINVKMPHVTEKTTSEKANFCSDTVWFKQKTRPRINYEWIRKTI